MKRWLLFLMPFISGCVTTTQDIEFIKLPCIKPHDNYNYIICSDFIVKINEKTIIVPKGFESDLASIPKFLWPWYAPQRAEYVYPAILHDFLYDYPGESTRKQIDDIFYNALISSKAGKGTAYKFYIAVRLFGAEYFGR